MTAGSPLTVTVEEAGRVLGVARSTAYELVRTGELKCIRLRRRIVIPIAHLAARLDVTPDDVRGVLEDAPNVVPAPDGGPTSRDGDAVLGKPTLF